MRFEQSIQRFAGQPLTQQILMEVLSEYNWPHNKVRELEKQQMLTPIKRGLYITGKALNLPQPPLALLANHLYGPSYVSLEAALAHWGMIPERVWAIGSITTGLSKTFHTSVGRFTYIHADLPYYSFGIQQVRFSDSHTVLMASREKALCDKIVTTKGLLLRSMQQTRELLENDLRIDLSELMRLDISAIKSWLSAAPKRNSLEMLIKTLENL
ncbi:type IV toxin-antitoxin system AbiEi family antitoxin domain-containing protein [Chitinophaga cymbidii]|uniref:Transcriptional regulator, AbiEi antitoxin, Type IV TA system n=1 Tax=Chitinophaga cymbidii TaxID=1096750 RepID=A0A512REA0_9BACT|nr:hypothetical protein [Chitinophaga cymbidii]GEP94023.1 hypothetical protein CCY01nite_02830 [Chitinophaga cymbidii]